MISRKWLGISFLIIGTGIFLNAVGYHLFKSLLSSSHLSIYETASRYWLWGGIWLGLIEIASNQFVFSKLGRFCIYAGWVMFCCSLFLYLLFPYPILMMVTPLGGILMIMGFLIMGIRLVLKYEA